MSLAPSTHTESTAFDIDTLIDESDRKLFRGTTQPGHSLHHLLPPKTYTYRSHQLRKKQHPFLIPTVQYSQFKNCLSVVVYLNMYNITLRHAF